MRADGSAAPGVTAFGPVVSAHPDEMPQVFTPSARPAPIDASPQIVVARGFEELTRHRLALDDLATDTLERNVFYESILAEPAARSLGTGRQLEFVFAFDEAYRAFSPGFLLEVENVRRLHQRPEVRWMDSCADAQHAMINRLWPGRRTMATVLFATGPAPGELLVSLMPLLRLGRRQLTWPSPRCRPDMLEGS